MTKIGRLMQIDSIDATKNHIDATSKASNNISSKSFFVKVSNIYFGLKYMLENGYSLYNYIYIRAW